MLIWTAGVLDSFNDHNKYNMAGSSLLSFTSKTFLHTYRLTEVKLGKMNKLLFCGQIGDWV